ncbi:sap30-binding protein [Limosa lapponica baueri]|uniref:Sap30-binding protein n=1 Tax=Limosa lapponica baueri TaxID=1758121 RepID=A0A2I0TWN2_LIMLA|nr:sap30-binding protein [Limosa lapponica baueri]
MVFVFLLSLGEKGGLVSVGYGDDDFSRVDGDEEGYEEEDDENSRQSLNPLTTSGYLDMTAFCRDEDDDSETEKPEAGDLKIFATVADNGAVDVLEMGVRFGVLLALVWNEEG